MNSYHIHRTTPNLTSCLTIKISFIFFLFFSCTTHAITHQAGDIYSGGSKVDYPENGLSYILPKNTTGTVSNEHPEYEMLVNVHTNKQLDDSILYIRVGRANFETIAQEMSGNINFDGIDLLADGKATILNGSVTYNDFHIQFEGESNLRAFVMALIADNGTGLMMTAIASNKVMPDYKKAMFKIAETTLVTSGSATRQTGPSIQYAGNSKKYSRQSHEIVGVWMNRHNQGSGGIYIENTAKWVFSANGVVAWGTGAIVAGGTDGVSLQGGGDNPPDFGRWKTEGDILSIQWDDGTNGVWTFSTFDYYGTPILVLTTQDGSVYRYKKID